MNKINILPLGFIEDEHHDLRIKQTSVKDSYYRKLTRNEIDQLEMQKNRCHNWSDVLVTNKFEPMQIKLCSFSGKVRIDDMEPVSLEFHDLILPVGLYSSNIYSCDIGKNCSVNNVSYISKMILGEQVILKNVNEIVTSNHAKFGNGIVKEGEDPDGRIKLEIANEAGGREILPFSNMLTTDAYIWYKHRENRSLMNRLQEFVDSDYSSRRGYYGSIGDRTIIKNSRIIKDVIIGSDAYIKGCNKLKNITVKSNAKHKTQIGEGCELVNGIIGEGCRIFYGAMAVRFQLMAHSSLKYGARLINSVLGENSTISCCEVLNSFIYPGHEQHHNSSFLIAALLKGQTNIASGATIGSNHNSRKNDGEIVAGRGFWPGLNCSLKHSSKFASFNIVLKGSYMHEINNPLPFSLISQNIEGKVQIFPGYWFLHNMYALTRNSWKYRVRDKREFNIPNYDYDYLAPDTVEEMFIGLNFLEKCAISSFNKISSDNVSGEELLLNYEDYGSFTIFSSSIENRNPRVVIHKPDLAYKEYKKMINYYAVSTICKELDSIDFTYDELGNYDSWINAGGHFMPKFRMEGIITDIEESISNSWDDLHKKYIEISSYYKDDRVKHAILSLLKINKVTRIDSDLWKMLLLEAIETRIYIKDRVIESRTKDYRCRFRQQIYDSKAEMNSVLGLPEHNDFFNIEEEDCRNFIKSLRQKSTKYLFK